MLPQDGEEATVVNAFIVASHVEARGIGVASQPTMKGAHRPFDAAVALEMSAGESEGRLHGFMHRFFDLAKKDRGGRCPPRIKMFLVPPGTRMNAKRRRPQHLIPLSRLRGPYWCREMFCKSLFLNGKAIF